jgi:predicted NAD/FAD-dependent oxidoreductase
VTTKTHGPDLLAPDVPVVVVGGGISGLACARAIADAGLPVRVIDRGRRLGGRMAVRHEDLRDGRRAVDIGAPYFTVRDPRFAAVVESWRARGLARIWTDTFALLGPDGPVGTTTGAPRWSARGGLRCLVEDLAVGLPVTQAVEVEEVDVADGLLVDGEPAAAVVLAMPEPQAYDLLPEPVAEGLGLGRGLDWSPTIAVWAAWERRWWPDLDGAFVDGSPVVSWLADDGRRRADGAAVLVAHTTGVFAEERLDDPQSAVGPVLAELSALLGGPGPVSRPAPAPLWARAHRWSLAAPRHPHEHTFALHDTLVGVCGDAWGPRARIEQAWVSGHELGQALVARFSS